MFNKQGLWEGYHRSMFFFLIIERCSLKRLIDCVYCGCIMCNMSVADPRFDLCLYLLAIAGCVFVNHRFSLDKYLTHYRVGDVFSKSKLLECLYGYKLTICD